VVQTAQYNGKRVGNYLLETALGSGGEGSVFLARDLVLRRSVAVKVLRSVGEVPGGGPDVQVLEEARLIALLDHPNIVRVMHVELADDTWYVIMEMVDGGSLDSVVNRTGPFGVQDALAYTAQIADALSHAHEIGIIHRDVKPKNLLVSKEGGWIKLADFGLAKPRTTISLVTRVGVVGTPQYLAPEVWEGAPHSNASDVYSLGGCLHFMLTGRAPFQGTTIEALKKQHLQKTPPTVKQVPPAVAGVLRACLSKRPEQRPSNAYEVLDEVHRILHAVGGERRRSRSTTTRQRKQRSTSSKLVAAMQWRSGEEAVIGLGTLANASDRLSKVLVGGGNFTRLSGPFSLVLQAVAKEAVTKSERRIVYAGSVELNSASPRLLTAMAEALRHEDVGQSADRLVEGILRHHAVEGRPLVEIDLNRPWSLADSEDVAQLEKASRGRVAFLVLDSSSAALPYFQNVEVSALTEEEAQRFPAAWTAPVTKNQVHWSPDAIRLAKYFAGNGLFIDTVVLNSVGVAIRAEMAVVTTWCVMEVRARRTPIKDLRELPSERRQPEAWPDAQTLDLLKSIRS
jgi:serine/threonine protein kinase